MIGLTHSLPTSPMGLVGNEIGSLINDFKQMQETIQNQTQELKNTAEKAEAANYAKSRFLATMSHEIRTPLADNNQPKILVAEDSKVNQMFAEEILKELGCNVEIGENGAIAFEKYQNGTYDFVLMDCMMPEMDGYETTHMIREFDNDNNKSPVPIVAMTANAMEGDREKCLAAGMDDYIAKPARREDIKNMLDKFLGNNTDN